MEGFTSPQEELESLDVKRARLQDIVSNDMASAEVQRHLRQTLEQVEQRMVAIDPRRTRIVIAHQASTFMLRKAA